MKKLLDVTAENFPLIGHWLRAEHVRRFWGEPEENLRLVRKPAGNPKFFHPGAGPI